MDCFVNPTRNLIKYSTIISKYANLIKVTPNSILSDNFQLELPAFTNASFTIKSKDFLDLINTDKFKIICNKIEYKSSTSV